MYKKISYQLSNPACILLILSTEAECSILIGTANDSLQNCVKLVSCSPRLSACVSPLGILDNSIYK